MKGGHLQDVEDEERPPEPGPTESNQEKPDQVAELPIFSFVSTLL